jgi:hypothetical protein
MPARRQLDQFTEPRLEFDTGLSGGQLQLPSVYDLLTHALIVLGALFVAGGAFKLLMLGRLRQRGV